MGQLLLFVVVALVVATIVFGVTVMVSGRDPGLAPVEPDGAALPLPSDRPLGEEDVVRTRFDTAVRGYRMSQVDQALQRAAYDIGYKSELIGVLEAEVAALREGRLGDADVLRKAREAAVAPQPAAEAKPAEAKPVEAKPVEPAGTPGKGTAGGATDVEVTGGGPVDPPPETASAPAARSDTAVVTDAAAKDTPAKDTAVKDAAVKDEAGTSPADRR